MDDPDVSLISESEVLRGALLPLRRTEAESATNAKLVQSMENKTPDSVINTQESDERWSALTNVKNLFT